jgi:hypothetical protein
MEILGSRVRLSRAKSKAKVACNFMSFGDETHTVWANFGCNLECEVSLGLGDETHTVWANFECNLECEVSLGIRSQNQHRTTGMLCSQKPSYLRTRARKINFNNVDLPAQVGVVAQNAHDERAMWAVEGLGAGGCIEEIGAQQKQGIALGNSHGSELD